MKKIYVILNSPDTIDFKDIADWFKGRSEKDSFELELMNTLLVWFKEEKS